MIALIGILLSLIYGKIKFEEAWMLLLEGAAFW
jgi:hypothetical protein